MTATKPSRKDLNLTREAIANLLDKSRSQRRQHSKELMMAQYVKELMARARKLPASQIKGFYSDLGSELEEMGAYSFAKMMYNVIGDKTRASRIGPMVEKARTASVKRRVRQGESFVLDEETAKKVRDDERQAEVHETIQRAQRLPADEAEKVYSNLKIQLGAEGRDHLSRFVDYQTRGRQETKK